MKETELLRLTRGRYTLQRSPRFGIAVLAAPPQAVLRDDNIRYKDPAEVVAHWEENPDDDAYRARDGYVYFNAHGYPAKPCRLRDISSDISRIVNSEEMRRYLDNLATSHPLKLVPDYWTGFQMELSVSSNDKKYVNACFDIPGEDYYKMSVDASKAEGEPKIKLGVFITHPEVLHWDGRDHLTYPVYLLLAAGKIIDQKAIRTIPESPLMLAAQQP